MNAIDTNVFVYLHDADEPLKQSKATTLLNQLVQQAADTILLWQVAAELLSCLRKWESVGKISQADVEANFRDVLAMFSLYYPTVGVLDISFDLRSKYSLSHWDSLLVAACKVHGVSMLYSEDLDDQTDYDGVTVVNPFA